MSEYDISNFILLAIAGTGAGIVTGLAGASAATIVNPLLYAFTSINPYIAVAIALFTDVFASFFSFLTFKKNGNINMKDGVYLTITACIGSIIGSYLSSYFNSTVLGVFGSAMTFILGLNFLRKGINLRKNPVDPNATVEKKQGKLQELNPILVSSVLGIILGLVCGIVGAGGGLMILFVLTAVLNYDTKMAIGTSVLIMTFTALSGGLAHIPPIMKMENVDMGVLAAAIAITSFFGVIGAKVSAAYANKTTEDVLMIIVGTTFTVLTLLTAINKLL